MISWIKHSMMLMLVLFSITMVSAQDVRYYKLIKKKENGTISTNVSGGQFVTFRGDVCFESNKKGVGVDHGTMQRNENYSNSQYLVYQRKSGSGCYWGKDATFKFTADKSELNVVLENGDVYAYKCATAPTGQETCSLIHKKSSSNQGGSGIVMPPTPITVDPYNPTTTPTPQPTPTPQSTPPTPQKRHDCGLCGGSGEVTDDTTNPSFGNTKYCDKCRKTVPSGHFHKRCPSCDGKGYW